MTTVDITLRFLLLPQLRALLEEGFDVTGISAPGRWVADLERTGIHHVAWPHATRAWAPGADLRAFLALVRILRDGSFDVVHTHNPKPGIMGRVAARLAGVPVVVNTVHGLYATPEDRWAKRAAVLGLEGLASRFSDLELYQSEEDLAWARRLRLVRPGRSQLLGNGTDLERFRPAAIDRGSRAAFRARLGLPVDAVVVGAVGRLVAEKGYRELFAAARRVRAVEPAVRFLVVGGPDPEKSDSLSESEIQDARSDVAFTGWREDVRELMAIMDVFVLASWREGLPRSAIEAAAMGIPSVLTEIRGCREVVRDGVEGLLVPPRQPTDLAGAILRLVRDPSLRDRLGSAARRRARERFDERRVARIVIDGYSELLGAASDDARGVRLRRARRADVPALARLHSESLPDAFLPKLGDRFLRTLYRAIVADPEALAVVAENARGPVGFAAAVPSVERFYRRFYLRHGVRAGVAAAPHLLRRGTLRRLRESATYGARADALPDAELLSIAVDARCRSAGVGTAMAHLVLDGLAERGATEVKVVVGADNGEANRFYERLGFRLDTSLAVHRGTASNVWVIPCSS